MMGEIEQKTNQIMDNLQTINDGLVSKDKLLKDALDELKKLRILMGLISVKQVIKAGDEAINACGLNPWCVNEGRATGDEKISTWSVSHLIDEIEKELDISED